VIIAGAGMAGLVAAARAGELGARPLVYEKGTRAGGSMLLSSGVIWRHREWEAFRRECPGGDERLQRLVWERLDDALAWLGSLGATVVATETGNELTAGMRFDTRGLTDLLCSRVESINFAEPAPLGDERTIVLATGGFGGSADLVERYIVPAAPLRLRANPWSTGDGLTHALDRGAGLSGDMSEFYGRNMPDAHWTQSEYVSAAQLYARRARIFDADGVEFFNADDVSWSETNVVQATARRPGARAYYLLGRAALASPEVADRAGPLLGPGELPFEPPPGIVGAVRVVASITHTIGGIRVDERARVLDAEGQPVAGLLAAGVDAGGVASGGYASGLAQALVLGLVAAEEAVGST
jgi:succinate dehydrogenase/fumarate reductase flavoprotein subunit